MPVTVFRSNHLEELADHLAGLISEELKQKDLFARPKIIVPNKGIAQFLTCRFTRRNGLTMGMEFPFLMTSLLRDIQRTAGNFRSVTGGGVPDPADWTPEINPDSLSWRIFSLLPELLEEPAFAPLAQWLGDTSEKTLKAWQLSCQLGKLFDQYCLYRPDWITQWSTPSPDEPAWQPLLWRRITGDGWGKAVFPALWRQLQDERNVPQFSTPIRLFGFSFLPVPVTDCLAALGKKNQLELYLLSPCGDFWGNAKPPKEELREFSRYFFDLSPELPAEDRRKKQEALKKLFFQNNPLLGSLAGQGRELFNRTLEEGWTDNDEFSVEPETDTLLHRLQSQIWNNLPLPSQAPPDAAAPFDRSLQIHNATCEFREVEALHDELLRCFEEDPTLTLNDIFIMTPSPSLYAPYVDAVFHNPADTGCRLSVSASDRSGEELLPELRTFLEILNCFRRHFEFSTVFRILSSEMILQQFQIDRQELEFCRQKAQEAGIRWGWDEEEHAASGGVAFRENSWRAGLDRLLAGYAMLNAGQLADGSRELFALDGFGGSRGGVLGRFCDFLEKLHETAELMRMAKKSPQPFPWWEELLKKCAADFFGSGEVAGIIGTFLSDLHKTVADAGALAFPLSPEVVSSLLDSIVKAAPDSARGFLRGKITFCGLRPMRSIPAKVICLIGMNHNSFPGVSPQFSFDLMRCFPRRGDPSLREDEKELFLELLLSAREKLYVSFCGHGIRTGKISPPSQCVVELRGYLAAAFGRGSWMDVVEPLQAFSPELFRKGNAVSYRAELCRAARSLQEKHRWPELPENTAFYPLTKVGEPEELPAEFRTVSLAELITFFTHPANYFFRNRLKAAVRDREQSSPEDSELLFLTVDKRERYGFFAQMNGEKPENWAHLAETEFAKARADGRMPLYPGLSAANWEEWNRTREICLKYQTTAADFSGTMILPAEVLRKFQTAVGEFTLSLPEAALLTNGQETVSLIPLEMGNLNGKSALKISLNHLAVNLRHPIETIVSGDEIYHLAPLPAEAAEERMKHLLELYAGGMGEILPFFPKTAFDLLQGKDPEKTWSGDKGEKKDFARFFAAEEPDYQQLAELAASIFLPFEKEKEQ